MNATNLLFLMFVVKALADPAEEQWVKDDLHREALVILQEAYNDRYRLPAPEHRVHL